MAKKRGFALLAALAFAVSIVDVVVNKEKIWFGIVRIVLYAIMAVLLLLNGRKALKIPLFLLLLLEGLCIIPYSYKLTHDLAIYFEQPIPSWWDEMELYSLSNQAAFEGGITTDSMLGWLGIGTMNWLHIECIGALLGVFALLVTVFSRNKPAKKASWFMIMLLMGIGIQ